MIYINHFSFVSPDRQQKADGSHGYFTCVVEADSAEKAMDKFQLLLGRLRKTGTLFDDVERVDLDSCIEIRSIPKNGFLVYFKEIRGECLGAIFTELVGVSDNSNVSAYQVGEDHAKDEDSSALEPFLIFDK